MPKKTSGFYGSYRKLKNERKEIIEGHLPFLVEQLSMVPALVMRPCHRLREAKCNLGKLRFSFFADLSQVNSLFSLVVRKPDMTYGIPGHEIRYS